MSSSNTVTIISNAEFAVQEMKGMLVLLRDIDKIECFDYYDAEENIKQILPSVIILHSSENDKNCLKLIKKIKEDEKTKNIPVILYAEYSNADYIVEAFDLGINDILTFPLKDYELVIRVIWAIQKSESDAIKKTKDDFLANLGIIDKQTGFYKEEFSLKYLESVANQSSSQKQKACLMQLRFTPAVNVQIDKDTIARALKTSIRMNDTIAMKDDSTYYIFLSKAKLNGVYSVYERILSKIGALTVASASVAEIGDELFDDVINVLDFTIEKAPTGGEIQIVSKQDFIDMYGAQEKQELEIAELLQEEKDETEEQEEELTQEEQAIFEPIREDETPEKENVEDFELKTENEEDELALGLKIMQEKIEEFSTEEPKPKKRSTKRKKKTDEQKEVDERNAILYKQSYKKKLDMIVAPLLKKYASKLQTKNKTLDANINVSPKETFMKLDKDDIKLNFEMKFDKIKNITFKTEITALGTDIENDTFSLEVTDFDFQKFNVILKTITEEYENYLTED